MVQTFHKSRKRDVVSGIWRRAILCIGAWQDNVSFEMALQKMSIGVEVGGHGGVANFLELVLCRRDSLGREKGRGGKYF